MNEILNSVIDEQLIQNMFDNSEVNVTSFLNDEMDEMLATACEAHASFWHI